MKKLSTYPICKLLLVLIFAFTINSCQKETNTLENPESLDLISQAKQQFNSSIRANELPKEILSKNEKIKFQQLNKKVLWDYAKVKKSSFGEAVRIPILYDKETLIKAGRDKKSMSLYNLSYLMMYKDKKNKMQTEWVVTIPDDDYVDRKRNSGVKFSGLIHVFDWNGNLLKSYKFTKEGEIFISTNLSFNTSNIKVASDSPIKSNSFERQCTTTDWFTCSGTVDAPRQNGCEYAYSTTVCDWVYVAYAPATPNETGGGGGGGTPSDYIPDETDCPPSNDPTIAPGDGGGVSQNSTTICSNEEAPVIRKVITDSLDNVEAICIFNKLMQNQSFKDLINAFQGSKDLNLIFKMGNPVNKDGNSVAGQTHHDPGTTNFSIIIDRNRFAWIGAIEAANTFLHEAFHANLWITAQQWYPNSLPSNFQNMSLVDQIKYLDDRGGNDPIQHNYMAGQINQIALALKKFTRINYPVIYNNNLSYDTYLSMAHNGLQLTKCYEDYLNSLPGNTRLEKTQSLENLKVTLYTDNKCP